MPPVASNRTNAQKQKSSRGISIKDVAKLAGVSWMTVSRVINNAEKVSDKTYKAVKEAIEKTGYIPNRLAGSLSSLKTRQAAVLVPSLSNLVFSDFLDGLASQLEPNNFQMLVCNYHYNQDRLADQIINVLSWNPAGLVVIGSVPPSLEGLLKQRQTPVVEAFELLDQPFDCNVGISHEGAGNDMGAYLAQLGYEEIGIIYANGGNERRTRHRVAGFMNYFEKANLATPACYELQTRSSISAGREIMREIITRHKRPDAIFCANDDIAFGAMMECVQKGLQVPQEMGIAGFNGLDLALMCQPSLTTVIVDRNRMGSIAGEMLFSRLAGGPSGAKVDIGYVIQPGQSTRVK